MTKLFEGVSKVGVKTDANMPEPPRLLSEGEKRVRAAAAEYAALEAHLADTKKLLAASEKERAYLEETLKARELALSSANAELDLVRANARECVLHAVRVEADMRNYSQQMNGLANRLHHHIKNNFPPVPGRPKDVVDEIVDQALAETRKAASEETSSE